MKSKHAKFIALLLISVVFVRYLWLGDDLFLTMRTVDNCVNGYGLVWNVGERVQVFTHPLWMLIIVPFYFFIKIKIRSNINNII